MQRSGPSTGISSQDSAPATISAKAASASPLPAGEKAIAAGADSPRVFDPFLFKAEQVERYRASLRDPERVRFTDVVVVGRRAEAVVCGKVARRDDDREPLLYGRFIVAPGLRIASAELTGAEMDARWAALCGKPR